jgi:hypothetical protein
MLNRAFDLALTIPALIVLSPVFATSQLESCVPP